MNGLLSGKRIVVTGAARGLGYHFAQACAEQGAAVVMCDILKGELAESAHRLREQGYAIESHVIDLADQHSIDQVFSAIGEQGQIDGLVNNAAMATGVGGKNMLDYDPISGSGDERQRQRHLAGDARRRAAVARRGRHCERSVRHRAVGCAAPDGLRRQQGGRHCHDPLNGARAGEKRIRINAIAPGLTRVEATEYVPAERHQLYENGRALTGAQQPEDVTGSVVWLLSDLSRFITGQLIPVNGGFVFN